MSVGSPPLRLQLRCCSLHYSVLDASAHAARRSRPWCLSLVARRRATHSGSKRHQPNDSGAPQALDEADEGQPRVHILRDLSITFPTRQSNDEIQGPRGECSSSTPQLLSPALAPTVDGQSCAHGLCVLGLPGSGITSLLRIFAAQLNPSLPALGVDTRWSGEMAWNGRTFSEWHASGVDVRRLVRLAEGDHEHPPFLRTEEVVRVTAQLSAPPEWDQRHIQDSIQATLKLCALTDVAAKPVSGIPIPAQRRLSIAEALVTPAAGYILDGIDECMDQSMVDTLMSTLHRWSTHSGGIFIVSFRSVPTAHQIGLFEQVLLLNEKGTVAFMGTPQQLLESWRNGDDDSLSQSKSNRDSADQSVAAAPAPAASSAHATMPTERPETVPRRGDCLALDRDKSVAYFYEAEEQRAEVPLVGAEHELAALKALPQDPNPLVITPNGSPSPILSSPVGWHGPSLMKALDGGHSKGGLVGDLSLLPCLLRRWLTCSQRDAPRAQIKYALLSSESQLEKSPAVKPTTAYLESVWPLWTWRTVRTLVWREWALVSRNRPFWMWSLFASLLMGIILSTLFIRMTTGPEDAPFRFGLAFYTSLYVSFSCLAELPLAANNKRSAFKLLNRGQATPGQYLLANTLAGLPVPFGQTILLSTLDYWMTHFTPDVGRFLYFLFIMILASWTLALFFRALAYVVHRADEAQLLVSPLLAFMLILGGFLVTPGDMPSWIRESFFWFASPFGWIMRSTVINEFHADRYSQLASEKEVTNGGLSSAATRGGAVAQQTTVGDSYLALFEMASSEAYRWAAVGYLFAFACIALMLAWLGLRFKRFSLVQGERRTTKRTMAEHTSACLPLLWKALTLADVPRAAHIDVGGQRLRVEPGQIALITCAPAVAEQCIRSVQKQLSHTTSAEKDTPAILAGWLDDLHGTDEIDLAASSLTPRVSVCSDLAPRSELMGGFTVRETLLFHGRLLRADVGSHDELEQEVDSLLRSLELHDVSLAAVPVGDLNRTGLSDSQLLRLRIAVEIMRRPALLFVRSSFHMMGPAAEEATMNTLRSYARSTGAMVLMVRSDATLCESRWFDHAASLSRRCGQGGSLVDEEAPPLTKDTAASDGDTLELRALFASDMVRHCHCSDTIQLPARTASNSVSGESDKFHAEVPPVAESVKVGALIPTDDSAQATCGPVRAARSQSSCGLTLPRFGVLQHRIWLASTRESVLQTSRFWLILALSFVCGGVAYQLYPRATDQIQLEECLFMMYVLGGFCAILHATGTAPVLLRWKATAMKEIGHYRMYGAWSWITAVLLAQLPWLLLYTTLQVIPFYFLLGFPSDAGRFFLVWVTYLMLNSIFTVWSALFVLMFTAPFLLSATLAFSFNVLLLFGGVFQTQTRTPQGWKWLWYLDWVNKATTAMWIAVFQCDHTPEWIAQNEAEATQLRREATAAGCRIVPVIGESGTTEWETFPSHVAWWAGVSSSDTHIRSLHFLWLALSLLAVLTLTLAVANWRLRRK